MTYYESRYIVLGVIDHERETGENGRELGVARPEPAGADQFGRRAQHGYALIKDIEEFAGVRLGPGTLYGCLSKLEAADLIEPLPIDDRRRPYRATPAGLELLGKNWPGRRDRRGGPGQGWVGGGLMGRWLFRALLRLYPKGWRERYGKELAALCQDLFEGGEASRLRLVLGWAIPPLSEPRTVTAPFAPSRPSLRRVVAGALAAVATAMVLVSASTLGPVAPAGAVTLCQPHISHVSAAVAPGQGPDVTITGTCFGTGGAFNGYSDHFLITDLGPRGTAAELEDAVLSQWAWWDACARGTGLNNGTSPDVVTCDVPAWTDTSITLVLFGGGLRHLGLGGQPRRQAGRPGVERQRAVSVLVPGHCRRPTGARPRHGLCPCAHRGPTGGGWWVDRRHPMLVGRNPCTDQFGPGHELLPAPLGLGQCQYQWFINQSMQAGIAVYEADCEEADAVGVGAYQAMGRPFAADGFDCKAYAEGAGSQWAFGMERHLLCLQLQGRA